MMLWGRDARKRENLERKEMAVDSDQQAREKKEAEGNENPERKMERNPESRAGKKRLRKSVSRKRRTATKSRALTRLRRSQPSPQLIAHLLSRQLASIIASCARCTISPSFYPFFELLLQLFQAFSERS